MNYFYKEKRFWFIIIASVISLCLYFFWDSSFLIRSIATVLFLFIFYAGDKIYKIGFKNEHYIYFIIIVLAGVLASPLYFAISSYDKIQHFGTPILMSIMAYFMIDKLPLKKRWKLTYTFFLVLGILGLFEIAEYTLDQFFDFKLQGVFIRDIYGENKFETIQEPIDDTMIDLILGVIGSGVYSVSKALKLGLKNQQK